MAASSFIAPPVPCSRPGVAWLSATERLAIDCIDFGTATVADVAAKLDLDRTDPAARFAVERLLSRRLLSGSPDGLLRLYLGDRAPDRHTYPLTCGDWTWFSACESRALSAWTSHTRRPDASWCDPLAGAQTARAVAQHLGLRDGPEITRLEATLDNLAARKALVRVGYSEYALPGAPVPEPAA